MQTKKRKPQGGPGRPANHRAKNNRGRQSKPKNQSKLNPKDLLNQAESREESNFEPSLTYAASALHPKIKELLADKGYTHPTKYKRKVWMPF